MVKSFLKWCTFIVAIFVPTYAFAVGGIGLSFEEWIEEFRREAVENGITAQTLDVAFVQTKLLPQVISADRKQPEFRKDFQSYIDNAINALRIKKAQGMMKTHEALLKDISEKYNIPPHYLIAFWGMETDFGNTLGSYSIVNALSTLAYDTRRSAFFRSELMNAMKLVQLGLDPENMQGSWAGAMGNFQFMPSAYLEYGVDYNNDGFVDLWNSLPDAFASAANYLSNEGWNSKIGWAIEVFLPKKFDWSLIEKSKTLQQWQSEGVRLPKNIAEPMTTVAELFLPAGIHGPAFLVFSNFRVMMKWNNSVLYAIAVGHLADRILGHPAFVKKYNEKAIPFTLEDAMDVQKILASLDLYKGSIDGLLGKKSREAVRQFQMMYDLPKDGYANASLLHFMRLVVNGGVERQQLTFDEIVELQKILSKGQYYKGPLDGHLNQPTLKGIELYKSIYGIDSVKIDRHLLEKMRVQDSRNLENGEIEPLVKQYRLQEEKRLQEELQRQYALEREKIVQKNKQIARKKELENKKKQMKKKEPKIPQKNVKKTKQIKKLDPKIKIRKTLP